MPRHFGILIPSTNTTCEIEFWLPCHRHPWMTPVRRVRALHSQLSWKQIAELSRVGESYNVAPTNVMPIVRPAGNGRELLMARPGQGRICS